MFDISSDQFQLNPNYRLQYEDAQECHVLLYPEGLVKLSETAVAILTRCTSPTNGIDVIAGLQRTYPDAESLPADVMEFLIDAQSQSWIVAVED
ncbi:MAG: pyrroloquinoline quinone biosynthesis peptide chaperone PqqD [Porticoccaceae bacterium]|nr:pyrroloquinoline quinone biosynthesis peptide chaperone PqqD [Porticoccaceae bacterium]